jgi:hypothetical protein
LGCKGVGGNLRGLGIDLGLGRPAGNQDGTRQQTYQGKGHFLFHLQNLRFPKGQANFG